MALNANICKVNLTLANIDRQHYQDYRLTLAQHPSETDERLIVRLLAFALFAHEGPEFTKGLCVDEEPDLWTHSPTGQILRWVELGQPSEKRIRQACSQAEQVTILGFQVFKFKQWLAGLEKKTLAQPKLEILLLEAQGSGSPAALAAKSMNLTCTIREDQLMLNSDQAQATWAVTRLNPT